MTSPNPNSRLLASAGIVIFLVACCAFALSTSSKDALVVYCAHDSVYSEKILNQFMEKSGIEVIPRFDTESTKSLGLVNLILREKSQPRCDVFWNNELLGTLDLQDAGLLEPYKGPGYDRIPDRYKDPNGEWTGFAGRLRVGIFNTDLVKESERDLNSLVSVLPEAMALANPLYGTTRTHLTVLWDQMGEVAVKAWFDAMLAAGAAEVQGNAMVKNLVAAGRKPFGWTDTDDFYVAFDQGQPVDLAPVRLENGQTICIPNTVAIIKGTKKLDAAKQLVDFLLSAENELELANSPSRQIPLGDVDSSQVPQQVEELQVWAANAFDLREITSSRKACLDWLKAERLQLDAAEGEREP